MFSTFFNKTSPNILKIYIPRILGSVTQTTLRATFERLNIGKVSYVDMHRKINENKRVYYFAFIDIELYNTPNAKKIYELLDKNQLVKLVYDEEAAQYWEIKKYVAKDKRVRFDSNEGIGGQVKPVTYKEYIGGLIEEISAEEEIEDNPFDYEAYISSKPYNIWENDFDLHSTIINI